MAIVELMSVVFIVGLGGAMSPGALLTYTIVQSLNSERKSYKSGLFISLGHALAEICILSLLLIGLGSFFNNDIVKLIIGIIGACVLSYIGISLFYNLFKGKINTDFLKTQQLEEQNQTNEKLPTSTFHKRHPIIDSMIFLISNPHWWVWWITIGLGLMIKYSVSFSNPGLILMFFIAKEAGAVLWYTGVAIAIGFSKKILSRQIYLIILGICALFMLGYGLYLGIDSFLTYNIYT